MKSKRLVLTFAAVLAALFGLWCLFFSPQFNDFERNQSDRGSDASVSEFEESQREARSSDVQRSGPRSSAHHGGFSGGPGSKRVSRGGPLQKHMGDVGRQFSVVVRDHDIKPDPLASFPIKLKPRIEHPPIHLRMPPGEKIRLHVKFVDRVMARHAGGNQIELSNAARKDLNELVSLAHEHDLSFAPAFTNAEELDKVRVRAANRSHQMQADLNGTMILEFSSPDEVLGIAKALQSMKLIESVDMESMDQPPPPPVDIAPTTPDLESNQGYLNSNPGFGVNALKALGADGSGIRYSDCEYGYNMNHEDLEDADLTDNSRAPINSSVYTIGWDDHGTATIGITMAQDNGYGVTGIAPNCEGYFYSEWTTLGYSRTNSVSDAVTNSRVGDVILLEMQATGNGDYVPAEYSSTIWNLCKTASDAGIIVVAAAGNGNQNLDDAFYSSYMGRGDSGAIIIGAGSNNSTHSKLSFSTYGTRVDVQAWGTGVMTTGYGSYAQYGGDENQAYTSGFSGTSSASACAAGAVVLLQSYAKNVLGTLFTPEEMRAHLKSYGHAQGGSGGNIGPAIALNFAVAELPDRSLQAVSSMSGGSDVIISFWGLPFRTYTLEGSEGLGSWSVLKTNISGSKNQVDELLLNERSTYTKRFYRLSEE